MGERILVEELVEEGVQGLGRGGDGGEVEEDGGGDGAGNCRNVGGGVELWRWRRMVEVTVELGNIFR